MNIFDLTTNFWSHLQNSTQLMPYVFKELDRKYNKSSKIRKLKETDPDLIESLTGKVCVITGGTRGLGAEVVKVFLRKDCHVITGSSAKSESEIQKRYDNLRTDVPEGKGKLEIWHLDLRSMDSVVKFGQKFNESKLGINYFIANAGIMFQSSKLTADDFEEHFAINYLSHCLLIDHFIEKLYESAKESSSESRIVLVSSAMHKVANIRFNDLKLQMSRLSPYFGYGMSKLAQIMFANRMTRWLKDKGEEWRKSVTINSLHPGICNTELASHLPMVDSLRPLATSAFRSAKEGAETTIYAALSTDLNRISGKYLEDSALEHPSIDAMKEKDQNKLWEVTWNLLDKWTLHNWSQYT